MLTSPLAFMLTTVMACLFIDRMPVDDATPAEKEVGNLTAKQRELFEAGREIEAMDKEAQRLNHPDTFVEHSKIKRQMLKLEKIRDKLRAEVQETEQTFGGPAQASDAILKTKFKEIRKNATRNKILIAVGLTFLFDRLTVFQFDADQLFPLEYLIGSQDKLSRFIFRPSIFFAFLLVRFSNRLGTIADWIGSKLIGKNQSTA